MCQCVPQWSLLSAHLQMFLAPSHWSGSKFLTSTTPSVLGPHPAFWSPSCCPELGRSCSSGPARPTPVPLVDGTDFGVGQLRALGLGLGGSCAGQPTSSPLCVPPGKLSSTAPAGPQCCHWWRILHSCFQGQIPLVQCQLHYAALSRYRTHSPMYCSLACEGPGQFSILLPQDWLTRASQSGPTSLCCQVEVQGLLSQVLQPVREQG